MKLNNYTYNNTIVLPRPGQAKAVAHKGNIFNETLHYADTAETWEIYSWLSEPSGSNSIDSLNTVILIELVNQFDGSLAESGSYLCLNDFKNKTETALNVFKYADKTKLEQYFMSLGWRLDNSDDILDKYIQEIVANVKNEENLNMLSEITEKIRKYAHESRENW